MLSRILTEHCLSSPFRRALRELLYGAENQISAERVADLATGFSSYTTTSKTINKQFESDRNGRDIVLVNGNDEAHARTLTPAQSNERLAQTEATMTLAKDSADILLNPEGNLIQKLLVEESVRATSAQVKDNLRYLLVDGPKRFRDSLPLGVGSFLPPLPFEQISPFLGKTEEEVKAQKLAEKIIALVSQQQFDTIRQGGTAKDAAREEDNRPPAINALLENFEPEQLALLSKDLRENVPRYGPLLGLLGAKYTAALLQTASDNIDAALVDLEREGGSQSTITDGVTRATARGLSNVAGRSASAISDRASSTTIAMKDKETTMSS